MNWLSIHFAATLLFIYLKHTSGCPSLSQVEYDYLGPFHVDQHSGGGDSLEAYGGIRKIPRGDESTYKSELANGGKVGWKKATSDVNGRVVLTFPDVDTQSLSATFGHAASPKVKTYATVEFNVPQSGSFLVQCEGAESFFIDDEPFQADPFAFESWWGDSTWLKWPVKLSGGRHVLIATVSTQFKCSFECLPDGDIKLYPLMAVKPSSFNPGLVDRVPDFVDDRLASPYVSFPLVNGYNVPVISVDVKVIPQLSTKHLTVVSFKLQEDIHIVRGQAYPVSIVADLRTRRCRSSVSVAIGVLATFEDQTTSNFTRILQFSCKSFGKDAFTFTFLDSDGTVQYAAARPPQEGCRVTGCPIVFATHGAGVDAASPTWTDAFQQRKSAWILLPSNRDKYGFDWEGVGRRNGLAALDYLGENLPGVPKKLQQFFRPDIFSLVFTGHSMGGHGCMVFLTHYTDRALAAACASAWIRLDLYIPQYQDVGISYSDPTLRGILRSSVADYHVDAAAVNVKGIPFLGLTGANDESVHPFNLRRYVRMVDEVNGKAGFALLSEVPQKKHWWEGMMKDKLIDSFIHTAVSRQKPNLPLSFRIRALNLWNTGRGGIKILQFHTPFISAWIDVSISETDGVWTLKTHNVRRIDVLRPPQLKLPSRKILIVDGYSIPANFESPMHICSLNKAKEWTVCDSDQWTEYERSQLNSGPTRQIYSRPHIMIYGTQKKSLSNFLFMQARKLSNGAFWRGHGYSRIYTDVEVLNNINLIGDSSVILFGGPSINSFTQYMAGNSTLQYSVASYQGGFSIGGVNYTHSEATLLTYGAFNLKTKIYRDQLFVLIDGSKTIGIENAVNAFPDASGKEVPDFMVFGNQWAWKGSGGLLAAGFFGNDWKYRADISYPR